MIIIDESEWELVEGEYDEDLIPVNGEYHLNWGWLWPAAKAVVKTQGGKKVVKQFLKSTEKWIKVVNGKLAGKKHPKTGVKFNKNGVWTPRTGVNVCKFSKTTGQTCDRVYRLNTTRDSYSGMVATENRRAQPGDSGGPWFYGNTAYGVHSGYSTIGSVRRDQFSPAHYISSGLSGYRVMTQ